MKGKITKSDEGWIVRYDAFQDDYSYPFPGWNFIPLHPDDVKQINRDAQVFDNIEARIAAYPDVEFEIVSGFDNNGPDHFPQYAKIKTT
jgi:hypothetical protein